MTMTFSLRQADATAPDLSEFVLANRALRSGARLLADAVSAIAAGAPCPPERHDAIVWFAEHVLHEVAEHHRKEDDILWPVIVAAAGTEVDLDALCDEHGVLDGVLHRATNALRIFDTYCAMGAANLAAVLTELADDLDEHLDRDEERLFPVIQAHVPVRDFETCRARFALHHPSAHRRFVRSWLARGLRHGRPQPAAAALGAAVPARRSSDLVARRRGADPRCVHRTAPIAQRAAAGPGPAREDFGGHRDRDLARRVRVDVETGRSVDARLGDVVDTVLGEPLAPGGLRASRAERAHVPACVRTARRRAPARPPSGHG